MGGAKVIAGRTTAFAAAALAAAFILAPHPAQAQTGLSVAAFSRDTGLGADSGAIQGAWQALEAMGTTEFLGGVIGSFRLDEASMLAGAMTIGATEFDRFLRGGQVNLSSAAGQALSDRMTAAAGIDLSHLTGSFTSGGGGMVPNAASAASSGGAASSGACSTEVASALAAKGKEHVDKIVTAATDENTGFSQMSEIGGGGAGGGFAGLSCLEKLFQDAGSDIMFKPPTLGNLTQQLQNWSCDAARSVQEQVASAFGAGEIFQTGDRGGFFPTLGYGEANLGNNNMRPGFGEHLENLFGQEFAQFQGFSEQTMNSAGIGSLFR